MSANLGAEDTQVQSSSDVLEILQQVVIMLPELSFDVEMQLSNVNDKMKRLGKGQKHEWYALAAQAPESPELLMEIFYRTIVKVLTENELMHAYKMLFSEIRSRLCRRWQGNEGFRKNHRRGRSYRIRNY